MTVPSYLLHLTLPYLIYNHGYVMQYEASEQIQLPNIWYLGYVFEFRSIRRFTCLPYQIVFDDLVPRTWSKENEIFGTGLVSPWNRQNPWSILYPLHWCTVPCSSGGFRCGTPSYACNTNWATGSNNNLSCCRSTWWRHRKQAKSKKIVRGHSYSKRGP